MRFWRAGWLLCGCGALGTVLANHLARAGVGSIRIIDRDFIETHNLQRQVLFDEKDVADNLPKAEAAARKLRAINSTINIEPVVTDIDHTNILDLVEDADLILDGTDNFETRYLINDAAVKLEKPWIYGGVIGSEGQTMTILAGEDAVPSLPDRDRTAAGNDAHLRDRGRSRAGGGRDRLVRGDRSHQDPERQRRRAERPSDHGRRLGLDVPAAQGRRLVRQGRLPLLRAEEVRVARGGHGLAHDDPLRPQCRAGRGEAHDSP